MARGRMMDKRVGMSKKLGKVSDKASRLYFMIYPHLDKKGRIAFDDLGDLKVEIIPNLIGWGEKKIGEALNELADIGLIIMYLDKGKISMEFDRFEDFQTINDKREAVSKIVEPGSTPESSGVFRITPLLSLSLIKSNEGRKEEKSDYEQEFESLWKNYHIDGKKNKKRSKIRFIALCRKGELENFKKGYKGYANYLEFKHKRENFKQGVKYFSTLCTDYPEYIKYYGHKIKADL